MIYWVVTDAHRCVVGAGSSFELPEGAIEVPGIPDLEALGLAMVVDGVWTMRPTMAPPETTPEGFRLEGCPEGTSVWVSCGETGVVFGQTSEVEGLIEVMLPDPGSYSLEICPPAPWVKPEPLLVRIAP